MIWVWWWEYLFADGLDLFFGFKGVVGSIFEMGVHCFFDLSNDVGGPVCEDGLVGLIVHYN